MCQVYIKNILVTLVTFFWHHYSKIWPNTQLCSCIFVWAWSWQLELHARKKVPIQVQQCIIRLPWRRLKNITKTFSHFIQFHKFSNLFQALLKERCCRIVSTFIRCFPNECKLQFRCFYSIYVFKDANQVFFPVYDINPLQLGVAYLYPLKISTIWCFQGV